MSQKKLEQFLRGKRLVITGAGRGLGRALAIVSADHGAETVLLRPGEHLLPAAVSTTYARSLLSS